MRGSQGEWVGSFAKYVELHVDSLIVIGAITGKRSGSPNGRVIVEKIHRLLALEWRVEVFQSYREAN
jgi:hypothetical protein